MQSNRTRTFKTRVDLITKSSSSPSTTTQCAGVSDVKQALGQQLLQRMCDANYVAKLCALNASDRRFKVRRGVDHRFRTVIINHTIILERRCSREWRRIQLYAAIRVCVSMNSHEHVVFGSRSRELAADASNQALDAGSFFSRRVVRLRLCYNFPARRARA